MKQEIIFENIEQLMPILDQFKKKGTATITINEKIMLRQTFQAIHQGTFVDITCSTCIVNYLTILRAYYEREKPKWDKSQQKEEAVKIEVGNDNSDKVEEQPAPKKKRKYAKRKKK